MTRLTMEDYKRELKGAGPGRRDDVLARARRDPSMGFHEFMELCDYAYDQRPERRREHGAEE